ncbi:MAG: GWxTD domain-containing protein [Ignavibacteriales bacterium]|nr:GWxTD domain-containing protein [Ignavibacteriales bacterium]
MKRYASFVLLLFLATQVSLAQRLTPASSFVLNLDYAKFRNDDKSGYLEIYYGFYPRLVTYNLNEGKYVGAITLSTKLKNTATGELTVNDRSVLPVQIVDTSGASFSSTFISQTGYAVPFGEYTLQVIATDSLTGTRKDSIMLSLSVQGYPATVTTSDVELCSTIKNSTQKDDPFFKNSLEVMPNPTLVFGAASHPVIYSYSEFYNLDPGQSYLIKTQIVGPDGKALKEGSKTRKFGVKNAVEAGVTNVTAIQSGRYRFRLTLADTSGNAITQTEKTFYIYNPHIKTTQPTAVSLKASELAGLSAEELGDEFRKAQYFATDQEIKTFSQVTAAEGRRDFLAKFWAEVEAGRLGKEGISRATYLQRVLAANQRFRALSKDGWRADRGRVLILYSEPDEIQRYPSTENSKPYEIWNYYAIENGVVFVFVDRSGFGDYVLVNSTKRGELRDDSWERYLR